jgi:hypothetical protein
MKKGAIKKERLTFRRKDEWLHDCITKIVASKRAAGLETSFSYELIRVACNGLLNEMRGAEEDRKILRGDDNDSAN